MHSSLSLCPTLGIASGFWLSLSERQRTAVVTEHLEKASRILNDAYLPLPDPSELESIVLASFRAFHAYVAVGAEEPGPERWQAFFQSFVTLCGSCGWPAIGGEQIAGLDNSDGRHAAAN